jgi:hypothetical protein
MTGAGTWVPSTHAWVQVCGCAGVAAPTTADSLALRPPAVFLYPFCIAQMYAQVTSPVKGSGKREEGRKGEGASRKKGQVGREKKGGRTRPGYLASTRSATDGPGYAPRNGVNGGWGQERGSLEWILRTAYVCVDARSSSMRARPRAPTLARHSTAHKKLKFALALPPPYLPDSPASSPSPPRYSSRGRDLSHSEDDHPIPCYGAVLRLCVGSGAETETKEEVLVLQATASSRGLQ